MTLRPEMTPSLARMILSLGALRGELKILLPVKWFSVPQCWRFETVQRGRKREHYQWNMDIIGARAILPPATSPAHRRPPPRFAALDRPKIPQDPPRSPQDRPKRLQDRPKMHQERA